MGCIKKRLFSALLGFVWVMPAWGMRVNGQAIVYEKNQPTVTVAVMAAKDPPALYLRSDDDNIVIETAGPKVTEAKIDAAHALIRRQNGTIVTGHLKVCQAAFKDQELCAGKDITLSGGADHSLRLQNAVLTAGQDISLMAGQLDLEACFATSGQEVRFMLPDGVIGDLLAVEWLPENGRKGIYGTLFQGKVNLRTGVWDKFFAHHIAGVRLTFRNPEFVLQEAGTEQSTVEAAAAKPDDASGGGAAGAGTNEAADATSESSDAPDSAAQASAAEVGKAAEPQAALGLGPAFSRSLAASSGGDVMITYAGDGKLGIQITTGAQKEEDEEGEYDDVDSCTSSTAGEVGSPPDARGQPSAASLLSEKA